ncbi:MAG: hypothetical protein FWD92_03155 [Methanomassiliicoccaceae archaeon]|nr:hypothetical protein [Methanomassiliicoccaceae archaeon]
MTKNIVDEVVALIDSKKFEGNKNISEYVKAVEKLESLRKMGMIKEKGNNLLPIEERYKSVYAATSRFDE